MMTLGILCGGGKFTLEYMGSVGWVSGSTISGSVNIGAAQGNREIFMVVSTANATAVRTLTAATSTINGVPIVKATTEYSQSVGSLPVYHSISCGFATVPSGSGAVTCTATLSGAIVSGVMSIYRVVARPGRGNNQTDSITATNTVAGGITMGAITTNVGGMYLGVALAGTTGTINCTTGATEDADILNGSYVRAHGHYSRAVPDVGATRSESFNKTGNNTDWSAAGWTFA